tara:strand:- start:184 stop:588 length:405 start_codon:yes stop_codon:yes gene_type:complete
MTSKTTIIVLSAALLTTLNYAIWQNAENSSLELLVKASETRNSINLDENRELHKIILNNINIKNDEIIKNQGRLEGIVDFINKPDDYHEFWHLGYQHGLDQIVDMQKIDDKLKEGIEETSDDLNDPKNKTALQD